jgi:tetratricopeptide (TPR) repeat protein
MKVDKNHILITLIIVNFIFSQNAAADFPKTDLDFIGLPEYCVATQKPSLRGTAKQILWDKRMISVVGLSHACAGLFSYNLAWRDRDKSERNFHLRSAVNEMSYPLNKSPNSVLTPRLHYETGRAYEGLEEYDNALESYRLSIQANPKTWEPYAAISDILLKANQKNKAIEILEEGLKHKPDSKPLLKRLAKLKK